MGINNDLCNLLGSLSVKAKLYLYDESLTLHPSIRPNHKFINSNNIYIGEIIIDTDTFNKTDNGKIIEVCFLTKIQLKNKLEKDKKWKILSGNNEIGELELVKVIKFEIIF